MTNPKHTDTSRSGDLVAAMKDQLESWEFEDPREIWWKWQHQYAQAADLIETQAREIGRLREALGWYEKQANDCRKITREGDDARYALDRDGGERARAALGDSHDQ